MDQFDKPVEEETQKKSGYKSIGDCFNLVTEEIEKNTPETPWNCLQCGSINTAWNVNPEWIFRSSPEIYVKGSCSACAKKKAEEEATVNAENERLQTIARINRTVAKSGMPSDYARFAFKNLQIRPGAEKAFEYAMQPGNFSLGSPLLILTGTNNTGKSALMGALANRLAYNGIPSFYFNESILFSSIKESWEDGASQSESFFAKAVRLPDVILWDEWLFYNYSESKWIYERAYRFIEEACERKQVIVFATNIPYSDIAERCGKRIWARLERRSSILIEMKNQPFFKGIKVL